MNNPEDMINPTFDTSGAIELLTSRLAEFNLTRCI